MEIIPIEYKPPSHAGGWYTIHWSVINTRNEEAVKEHLAARNLNPETIYIDKGGTIWVPL